jgi:predicted molibdopterin-dependent oxidoreductase YjgC
MGALPELLPGGYPLGKDEQREKLKKVWKQDLPVFKSDWDVSKLFAGRRLKVAYFIGETPRDSKLAADFLIYQNHYPMDESNEADIILPAATFTEVDGTFINCEGRIQRVRKAADHTGMALPDWKILCKIAQKMGAKGFNFSNVSEIHKEMACFVKGFRDIDNKGRSADPLPPDVSVKKTSVSRSIDKDISRAFPFIFTTSFYEHVYRGLPITDKVEGLKKLVAEEALIMNPEDARKLGIVQGDEVIVTSTQFEKSWPAWISVDQEPGTVHVTQLGFKPNESNPDVVKIRRKDV